MFFHRIPLHQRKHDKLSTGKLNTAVSHDMVIHAVALGGYPKG
jgi:hypothetical protein